MVSFPSDMIDIPSLKLVDHGSSDITIGIAPMHFGCSAEPCRYALAYCQRDSYCQGVGDKVVLGRHKDFQKSGGLCFKQVCLFGILSCTVANCVRLCWIKAENGRTARSWVPLQLT